MVGVPVLAIGVYLLVGNPLRFLPPASQNLGNPDLELKELREYALELINEDRKKFGLTPVLLSQNGAAQAHAEDLYRNLSDSTHWTSDGMKPYMRYTLFNGTGYVAQNVHAGLKYGESDIPRCRVGLLICEKINIRDTLKDSEYSMMYDDEECCDNGHMDNILDKHHTHVSLGIVYDDYYFAHVQNFEANYITLDHPINPVDGLVSLQGRIASGYSLSSVTIHYDEVPTTQVYDRDKHLNSYSLGDRIAGVTSPGRYYDDIVTITADKWSIGDDIFEIAFDISSLTTKPGVYTIVVYLDDGIESFPAMTHSIFIT
jgi:hypothetical protein